jgi:competence protein ComEC
MFKHSFAKLVLFILVTADIFLYASIDDKNFFKKNEFNVVMIDVGQGDAILLKFPNGKTALVDAGNADYYFDNGERVILPLLEYLNIPKIDYGFVSHIDADHYGGFVSLIHEGKIKQIYKPPLDSSFYKDIRFENYLKKMNVPVHHYKRGEMKIGNVNIYILNDYRDKNFPGNTTNNMSGELKIVYGKTSFLFTGDAETTVEHYYVKRYKDFLKTDVLKVGHHGSNSSSSPQFLLKTKPEISLVSVGIQNKFGHPSSLIMNRLRAVKSKIYRTDIEGAIYLTSDGDSVKVIDWKK